MLIVRNILAALICVSPLALLWDGLIVQGFVAGIVAVAMAMTAISLRPGETEFLISVVRPVLIAAAIPALWVVLQIIPFGIFRASNLEKCLHRAERIGARQHQRRSSNKHHFSW